MINQVSLLLTQYHDLLNQTLEEKGHFLEESKHFSDTLNHLKRQKELLEDCIIEENRKMESSTPRAFDEVPQSARANYGAILARQLRKVPSDFTSRNRSSSEMPSVNDDVVGSLQSIDSELQGSELQADAGNPALSNGSNRKSDSASLRSPEAPVKLGEAVVEFSSRSEENSNGATNSNNSFLSEKLTPWNSRITTPVRTRIEGRNLTSAASSMLMSSSSPSTHTPLQTVQLPPRIPRSTISNAISVDAPSALVKHLQPSRTLALLERAGSRQPVCLPDADPEIVLPPDNVPMRILDSPLGSTSSASSDNNFRLRSEPVSAPLESNPLPRNQVAPNLTSTTRISVSISSPSVGISPQPSPRRPSNEPSDAPLLPIRLSRTDKPALPPRPSVTTSGTAASITTEGPIARNETVNQRSTPVDETISSVWYEYGCV